MYLLDPNKKIKEQKHPGEITDTIVDDFYVYSLMWRLMLPAVFF